MSPKGRVKSRVLPLGTDRRAIFGERRKHAGLGIPIGGRGLLARPKGGACLGLRRSGLSWAGPWSPHPHPQTLEGAPASPSPDPATP